MTGARRPILKLAWFEGIVVSLGALAGIISSPQSKPALQQLSALTMPEAANAFVWLTAFSLTGWIGWRLHCRQPYGPAFIVWSVMLVLLLAWRPIAFMIGAVWPGTLTLAMGVVAAVFLMPLAAAISLAAAWICVPVLIWLGLESVIMIQIATQS